MSVYTTLSGSLDFDKTENFDTAVSFLTNGGYLTPIEGIDDRLFWTGEANDILDGVESVYLNKDSKTIIFPNVVQRNIGRVFDKIIPLSSSNFIREVCLDGMTYIAEYNNGTITFELNDRVEIMKSFDYTDDEISESLEALEENGFDEEFEEQLYNWAS